MRRIPFNRCALSLLIVAAMFMAVPLAMAAPVGIGFKGGLADGGKFAGYIIYGDRDMEGVSASTPDGVPDRGRFLGGFWQVDVLGGSTTASASLSNLTGGRAPVETVQAYSLISLLTLGPEAGELPRLELLFEAAPTYDADVQPTVNDIVGFFFTLGAGPNPAISRYQDQFGVSTAVTTIEIFDATSLYSNVPLPGAIVLLGAALGTLLPRVNLRRRNRPALAVI